MRDQRDDAVDALRYAMLNFKLERKGLRMRLWDSFLDNLPLWFLIGILLFAGAFLYWAVKASRYETAERNRLIAQCMDDGKKEYECVALLKVDKQTTVVPVATPIYISR